MGISYNAGMKNDLFEINTEIEILLEQRPTMNKYERLSALLLCKEYFEKQAKTEKTTVAGILDDKMEEIGARATLTRLEPLLSKHIKDLELIAPTITGEFIKQLKEM